jgi:hypothetical protein
MKRVREGEWTLQQVRFIAGPLKDLQFWPDDEANERIRLSFSLKIHPDIGETDEAFLLRAGSWLAQTNRVSSIPTR